MTFNLMEVNAEAAQLEKELQSDVFFYNGSITRNNVLEVMEEISANKKQNKMLLIMVTYGGDPHAGYKIAHYIQQKYESMSLFVPGFCKSAGTLFAIAAQEIIFAPFGELGPLDVQMAKPDQFSFDSGLVIGESLDTLQRRATETFKSTFAEIMHEQQGAISVTSALHAASEITKAIYAPIMARIDPEEVGVRQRALRITLDYGNRLATASGNANRQTVTLLAEKYSSHSFVIDQTEASNLFRNVRSASPQEMKLVYALGKLARIEQSGNQNPIFTVLGESAIDKAAMEGAEDDKAAANRKSSKNGASSSRSNGSTVVKTANQG